MKLKHQGWVTEAATNKFTLLEKDIKAKYVKIKERDTAWRLKLGHRL